jgi:uncharacterized SAM-binding protein YcdF (DUF218 family)
LNGNRRWLWRLIWIVLILAVLGGVGTWAFRHVGTWLVVQDPLAPAQVAVVLSGDMPIRAIEAAEIYRSSDTTRIWITQPVDPTDRLHELGVDYLGEPFYNQRVLIALGVPGEATRLLEQRIVNTEDEIRLVSRIAREEDIHRVIIVTSKAHTRRVRTLWRKIVGSDPVLIVRYAREDTFDGAHWWRKTHDALEVVREVLGLLNTWSGFLVKHPAV